MSRTWGTEKPYFTLNGDAAELHNVPVPPSPDPRDTLDFWQKAFGWSVLLDTVLIHQGRQYEWLVDHRRATPPGTGERLACPLLRRLAALGVPTLVVAQYDFYVWQNAEFAAEQHRTLAGGAEMRRGGGPRQPRSLRPDRAGGAHARPRDDVPHVASQLRRLPSDRRGDRGRARAPSHGPDAMKREWAIRIGLVVGAVVVTLGALEIGVRAGPERLGHVLAELRARIAQGPDQRATRAATSTIRRWATCHGPTTAGRGFSFDAEGFRRSAAMPGGGTTPDGSVILAVGDSFTFGDEVKDDETWPAHLQQLLGRRVLNAGVSGYGFDQIVLRAEKDRAGPASVDDRRQLHRRRHRAHRDAPPVERREALLRHARTARWSCATCRCRRDPIPTRLLAFSSVPSAIPTCSTSSCAGST